MQKRCGPRKQNFFWHGWNLALEALEQELEDVEDDSLPPDAKGFKDGLLSRISELLIDEDRLKPKPTNGELAEKYAVSQRTVTNWRKADCPFEDGQWAVLDWLAERRYAPAGAKAKFARQLERRAPPEPDSLDALAGQASELLSFVKEAKRQGLL